jgi:hypothetical protein
MINVPESKIYQVDDNLRPVIDTFLKEVYNEVVNKLNIPKERQLESPLSYFEIRSQNLESHLSDITSNDRLTTLLYKERVIAGIIQLRTEFNHVSYNFFTNLEYLV